MWCRRCRLFLRDTCASLAVCWAVLAGEALLGAEGGDVDGDGRLTLGDVALASLDGDLAEAERSLDLYRDWPCFEAWHGTLLGPSQLSGMIYIEVLRRSVPDPLPHWVPFWNRGWEEPPLSKSEEASIRWVPEGSVFVGGDRAVLEFEVMCSKPLQAFSFLVESSDRVLRPTSEFVRFRGKDGWSALQVSGLGNPHADGDIAVGVGHPGFLVTNGRYIVNYGIDPGNSRNPVLSPGTYRVVTEARLPRSTPAGTYKLSVLETSQVLFEDGTVASPTIGNPLDLVLPDIEIGWDGGVPPFEFGSDLENPTIVGNVDWRILGAQGSPGDTVELRVQMRTSVPLNSFEFHVFWETGALHCYPEMGTVSIPFVYPEDGLPYEATPEYEPFCVDNMRFLGAAMLDGRFALGRAGIWDTRYANRVLEYFKPLNEWLDVALFRLEIPSTARGGLRIPIRFDRIPENLESLDIDAVSTWVGRYLPSYDPYSVYFPCGDVRSEINWHYEVTWTDGEVMVLGDRPGEPDAPEEIGLYLSLDSASGAPGDLVEMGIWGRIEDESMGVLQVVVETDSNEAVVEAIDVRRNWPESGEGDVFRLTRGESTLSRRCSVPGDPDSCEDGVPKSSSFFRSLSTVSVWILGSIQDGEMIGSDRLIRFGSLWIRISEGVTAEKVSVRFSVATPESGPFLGPLSSGAYRSVYFFPATVTENAVIRIVRRLFVRGDVNVDGDVNLSDAVLTLDQLFGGQMGVRCEDAADIDDNGTINLTDPIALLGSLFLGRGDLPAPFPGCGVDLTEDDLACGESMCEG